MRSSKALILTVFAFAAGGAAGYLLKARSISVERPVQPDARRQEWLFDRAVEPKNLSRTVSYAADVALQNDWAMPDVQQIHLKVKLAPSVDESRSSDRSIAYIAEIAISPLEKGDVPKEYLQTRVHDYKGHPVQVPPLEEITYVVQLSFDLLDKDGFTLRQVVGGEQWVRSGLDRAKRIAFRRSRASRSQIRSRPERLQLNPH